MYRLFFVLLIGVLAGCGEHEPAAPEKPVSRLLAAEDVQVAQKGAVVDSLPFTGTLNPLSSSVVGSELEGTVLAVPVREGETVHRNQVLARIDSRVAREALMEQEAQLANYQSKLGLARIKLEKQRELFQKGFISKLAFEEESSNFRIAEGEFRVQQTQLMRARKVLADSVLRAPIDGVLYQRKINPGEQAQRGVNLFSIADLSVMEVTASIPSQLVGRLKLGMAAQFRTEAGGQTFQGRLVRMNPVAMSGTRSFAVYIRVDNRDSHLRAGQFVQGGIALSRIDDLVALPLPAVHDIDGQPWVMIVQAGRLVRQSVTLRLRSETNRQAAVSGVAPGQVVMTGSLLGLKAGDAVTLPTRR
ncbi:efflux RND transporter periplasmic adaptor subunit [Paludibacterium purpuratum]|uniref:RND family efflux transporter MFP subunit n=1 Tax=Paludibacterium purpuratum TaxID=1144873 RepID=A0A4R7B9A4_9NEIS|nr:efflux RND transporter periplasmic adaptor subunit [Paludibacterium purpuratum]TDR81391.1 RND family efflux transporter MFP subunit [Paludibacterium purpuratum]